MGDQVGLFDTGHSAYRLLLSSVNDRRGSQHDRLDGFPSREQLAAGAERCV
jgi:hypothetical protein